MFLTFTSVFLPLRNGRLPLHCPDVSVLELSLGLDHCFMGASNA